MSTQFGAAVIQQIEKANQIVKKITFCDNCFALSSELPAPLKRCTGCQSLSYCSKECQKKHWSHHKPFCRLVQGKGAPNSFLTDAGSKKGEDCVIDIVIDSYRIRVQHDHLYRHEDHGIYYKGKQLPEGNVFASGDVYADFQNYLDRAEMAKILPEWWDFYKRLECLGKAVDRNANEQNIFKSIEEDGLMDRYNGDRQIRSTLIILAELAIGYEGKGPPKDGEWISRFKRYVNTPEVKERIEKASVVSLEAMYAKYGREFPRVASM
jgi:MYND finger